MSKKVPIKIFFGDRSYKTILVSENTTADEVCSVIAKKMGGIKASRLLLAEKPTSGPNQRVLLRSEQPFQTLVRSSRTSIEPRFFVQISPETIQRVSISVRNSLLKPENETVTTEKASLVNSVDSILNSSEVVKRERALSHNPLPNRSPPQKSLSSSANNSSPSSFLFDPNMMVGPQKPLSQFSAEDVGILLTNYGLEEYVPIFRKESVDGPAFAALDIKDFKELGVKIGHRKKMECLAVNWQNAFPSDLSSRPNSQPTNSQTLDSKTSNQLNSNSLNSKTSNQLNSNSLNSKPSNQLNSNSLNSKPSNSNQLNSQPILKASLRSPDPPRWQPAKVVPSNTSNKIKRPPSPRLQNSKPVLSSEDNDLNQLVTNLLSMTGNERELTKKLLTQDFDAEFLLERLSVLSNQSEWDFLETDTDH